MSQPDAGLNVAAPRERTGMLRALCLFGVVAVCWLAAPPSSRSADGFGTTDVQGFMAASTASFIARAPAPAMSVGYPRQPVNQGAVFGKRPQYPQGHTGLEHSWASPVVTGPGAPVQPLRGAAQDRQMDQAWAAGTISVRTGSIETVAGPVSPIDGSPQFVSPSAPIPAQEEDAAKKAWLESASRDAAPNAPTATRDAVDQAWATNPINPYVAAGPTPRQAPPGDGEMHQSWSAVNVRNRGNAPQSKYFGTWNA